MNVYIFLVVISILFNSFLIVNCEYVGTNMTTTNSTKNESTTSPENPIHLLKQKQKLPQFLRNVFTNLQNFVRNNPKSDLATFLTPLLSNGQNLNLIKTLVQNLEQILQNYQSDGETGRFFYWIPAPFQPMLFLVVLPFALIPCVLIVLYKNYYRRFYTDLPPDYHGVMKITDAVEGEGEDANRRKREILSPTLSYHILKNLN